MAKIVCVLYDDPVDGYPKSYARDGLPLLERYPDGQTLPTPKSIDFKPGQLLGSVSGELGLRKFLESLGHQFVVTSDKDGADSALDSELPDAEIVISQPFWPAYLTAERIAKAPKLKLAITAGIGSDHVDLQAAIDHKLTVAEVTLLQQHQRRRACRDDDPGAGAQLHSVLSMGRQKGLEHRGLRRTLLRSGRDDRRHRRRGPHRPGRVARLKPFDVKLHYTDRHRLPETVEKELNLTFHPNVESLVKVCDVVTINCPLHPETEHLFNDKLLAKMKRGAYLINTARGKICDRDAIVRALESGQLAGYAGDVWFPQPAPQDHPWRDDAAPRHDAAHFGHESVGPDPLCRRRARDSGVLVRGTADSRELSDRPGWQTRRRRSAFVQRRQCHARRGRSGPIQKRMILRNVAESGKRGSRRAAETARFLRVRGSAGASPWADENPLENRLFCWSPHAYFCCAM